MLRQYEPLEMLAPALFGQVQKWRHVASGDEVAVKRVELAFAARKRSKSSERAVEDDVFAEIKTNLRVKALGGHPHVLPLRDCITEDQVVLLVLKFCEQGELLGVLNERRSQLGVEQLLRYFAQILRGAAFLHSHGIAHRDLSLENVLLDEHDCCQITDFGLALSSAGQQVPARPVGKAHYMAPETCVLDFEEESAMYEPMAADVWALGVMLYAMLAARYPFREPLRRDDRFRLLADFGVDYLLEKDDVDVQGKKDAVDLLRRLLVVDPSERPTLADLLSHPALPAEEESSDKRLATTPMVETSVPTASQVDGGRARARSLVRVSPSILTPGKDGGKISRTSSTSLVKQSAVSASTTGAVAGGAKKPCLSGASLLPKRFATATA